MVKETQIKIKKLSTRTPCASISSTNSRLKSLQKIIDSSTQITEEMGAVIRQFHQCITYIYPRLTDNEKIIKNIFANCTDVMFRNFKIDGTQNSLLIFINGIVSIKMINSDVLKPLLNYGQESYPNLQIQLREIKDFLQNQVIAVAQISESNRLDELVEHVLTGDTALLIDGVEQALFISLREQEHRSIEEPNIEAVIRGSRDGFTESLQTNVSLLRRRLKTPKLKVEMMMAGRLSKTDLAITYIDGIVDNALISEVRSRIHRIDIDAILESGNIEELIEDNPYSIFPQFAYTERPDRLASSLLEGGVGIIVDNTPFVLTAPQTFFQTMQASEDYYERFIGVSLIRLIRYFFLFMSILSPALYVALSTFHQGMIPTTLLLTMANSRENVPFPSFIEALIMGVFFEGLVEASVRLPQPVGPAISIVGGLVIGQAAVQAGIVSAPMVIIASLTGIATFIIPRFNQSVPIRILRALFTLLAGILGLYGVFMGIMFTLIHMSRLRSFGVPYLAPVAPLNLASLKDIFFRVPIWAMITRPGFLKSRDIKRMKNTMRPRPPAKKA